MGTVLQSGAGIKTISLCTIFTEDFPFLDFEREADELRRLLEPRAANDGNDRSSA